MDKIQDVVRSFDGCGNIETWLKKLKLVAKLKEVKKLESFLPLFLEGDAFSVYDELFWFWFWFINQQDSLTNMFADVIGVV